MFCICALCALYGFCRVFVRVSSVLLLLCVVDACFKLLLRFVRAISGVRCVGTCEFVCVLSPSVRYPCLQV